MKKAFLKICILVMILSLGGLLGCSGNDITIQRFRVTFMSHDEAALLSKFVDSGKPVDRPFGNPSRDGWIFTDWFDQETGGTVFNFDTPITANTVIWARWAEVGNELTVTFMLHGGQWAREGNTAVVNPGDPVGEPPVPTRDGFFFNGWFDSAVGGSEWDFDDPVKENITLWAQWTRSVRVTFNLAGGNWDHPMYIDIRQGSALENIIPDPTKTGTPEGLPGLFLVPAGGWADWTFGNWLHGDNAWALTTPVLENMNLVASWTTPYGPLPIPDMLSYPAFPFETTNFISRAFYFMNENPGNYYLFLNEDVVVSDFVYHLRPTGLGDLMAGDILRNSTVTLMGLGEMRTITRGGLSGVLFMVTDNAGLILGENITLSGNLSLPSNAGLLLIEGENASLVMHEGSRITNHRLTQPTPVVDGAGFAGTVVVRGATFTMYDGEITGNSSAIAALEAHAGGVFVSHGGTFTMEDGKIFGNTFSGAAGGAAGGVFLHGTSYNPPTGSTFNMNGGQIFGNTIWGAAGDAAAFAAGGVRLMTGSTFNMNDGEIFNNTGVGGGSGVAGGVRVAGNSATFNMNSGRIFGNTVVGGANAGGVFVAAGATFNMNNNSEIYDNTAAAGTSGGGVTVAGIDATFNLNNGRISNNTNTGTALQLAGGVLLNTSAIFNMNDGEISNNSAFGSNSSGGVHMTGNARFYLNNGKIFGNRNTATTPANAAGAGGVNINNGFFEMRGGEIFDNHSLHTGAATNTGGAGGLRVLGLGTAGNQTWARIENGIIYGDDAPVGRRNTVVGTGTAAALRGIPTLAHAVVQHGNWVSDTWVLEGSFTSGAAPLGQYNDTIHVINGILQ